MLRKAVPASLGVLLLLSGCGSDTTTPAEAVPELADTLSSVDGALADHRFAAARRSLNTLVQTTVDAREAGELEPEQADRVLSAAARLLSALPAPRRPAADEPGQKSTEAPPPEEESDEEWEKKHEEWEKKQKEEQKELEEEQKELEEEQKRLEEEAEKKEEDDGGHNSGNGPDDGHGN